MRRAGSNRTNPASCARANTASRWRLPVVVIALVLFGSAASAQTNIYQIRGNATAGSNNIWSIDPTTGAQTLVYTGYPGGNAATLAQRASDGMIFYAINAGGGSNGAVYRFNPATPNVAPVLLGTLGAAVGSGYRMAFLGNTLYFMPGGGAADNDRLYTVNPATGLATAGPNITGTGNGGDMAFIGNTLYIINQNRQLYTATTAGGAATLLGTVTFPGGIAPGTLGLAVDSAGRLLIQTQSPSNLYRITLPSLTSTLFTATGGGTTATGDLGSAAVPAPNLSITKTDGVVTVYRGGPVTYTVVVTNNSAYGVTGTVIDTVPASVTGVTWTCVASAGSFCAAASGAGNAINTSATLEAGDTATYTVTGTLSATATGTLTNTATVAVPSWLTDSAPATNTATDVDTINLNANLGVTKTDGLANVNPGATVTYTIVVSNAGPDAANGSVFTDTVPASLTGVTWTCGSPTGGATCGAANGAGNSISTTANLPATSSVSYTVSGTLSFSATGILSNTATVLTPAAGVTDPNDPARTGAGNNSATDNTTINPVSDVTINKAHAGNFTQGQAGATYTLTVTNSGNAATAGVVTVTDTLPASLTPITAIGTGWTCNIVGQLVTCTRSDALAAASSYPAITITANVSATAPASVTNTAAVSGGGEVNTGNNSDSDPTTINPVADMTIAKTHTGNFTQGQTGATYTLTASNSGLAPTAGVVTVTDTLPASLTPITAIGTGWTCNIVGQLVTCTRSDALAASSSYPAITLTVDVSATAPASVTNTAAVSGGGEANTGNDSTSDPTTINPIADMTVAKAHTGNFTRGSIGTYTITATNSGGAVTSGIVTVTDTLPAGLTPGVATGTGWVCNTVAQTVTCTRANALNVGLSYPAISIPVSVAQNAAAALINTASVSGGGQINTSNDTSNDATTIVSSSDLSLTKVITTSGSGIGTNVTFTLTLTNSGPTNATNVAVRDQLPAGLTYMSSTPSTGAYNSGTGIWAVAALASGANATLQIVARIDSIGALTNTAQVTASDQPDPDSTPNNNNAAEDDQASVNLSTPAPNVGLCKTIVGQPCPPPPLPNQLPGSEISYIITFTNSGGSYASNFVITDPIPANTDFKVASATSGLGTTGLTVTIAYSNNGGTTWVYVPVSGGGGAPAGYDRNVTHVRWSFAGNLSQVGPNNTGNVGLIVRIR